MPTTTVASDFDSAAASDGTSYAKQFSAKMRTKS